MTLVNMKVNMKVMSKLSQNLSERCLMVRSRPNFGPKLAPIHRTSQRLTLQNGIHIGLTQATLHKRVIDVGLRLTPNTMKL